MNPTNLVEMIKAIAKEKINQAPLSHHADRYTEKPLNPKLAPKTLAQRGRYKPKGKDLAEEEKEYSGGKASTGKPATPVVFEPQKTSIALAPEGKKI